MFQKILLTVVAFIALGSIAATAADDPDFYIFGPFEVVGYDPSKPVAMREAFDLLQAAVTELEGLLPEGDEQVGVLTTHVWDGIAYELTYSLVILDGDP